MRITGLIAGILVLLAPAYVSAQQTTLNMTKKKAELLIPRPALQPVQSLIDTEVQAIDTIDTGSPHVKIILYNDNTWQYYKDPAYVMSQDIFTANWNESYPNPYKVSLDEMPDRVMIWTVDSLCQYRCPHQGKVYSNFGYRHGRRHMGVDLPLHTGDPVYAAFSGKVRMSRYYRGYGNLVILRHENGLETFYAHLSKRFVEVGDWVDAGHKIGLGGSTGRSTGAHLHFETRYNGYAFDPQWLIDFDSGVLRHRMFVLKKKYLNAESRYVPESDQEEIDVMKGDSTDYENAKVEAAKAKEKVADADEPQYYKVRSGDTLYSIARRNHTTVNALCRLNGISQKTTLRVGRRLRVR